MTCWLPLPLLTATLLAVWLILNESVSPGALILGGVLSVGAVRVLLALEPPEGRFRRPLVALRLALVVLGDIVRSNIAVARIILNSGTRDRTSGFVRIPLDLRAPYGLATLACIITATPGTIWVEYDSARNTVLLHILDLVDEETWIETIKQRYEKRLIEVFE
ncbi:Na+/H+ antiporter subunit E [Azospirillum thermophilum]|uniref:Na+/H+ antiporter subunit E n=1 Tax=Azospirillum thermophilum TaxID=2202148 RepID=A0A2S2CW02_9PROT|nr:Na+/H+ antiporter subunit E [Azospirillum thermophilum]AWK88585.1 Na+/H+ antiporter subunit E [Azospirillum thermophilum]